MENEIMVNEVTENVAEEVVSTTSKSGKAAAVIAGVGIAALAGGVIYKKVIKPIVAKIKANKEKKMELEKEALGAAEHKTLDEQFAEDGDPDEVLKLAKKLKSDLED